MQKTGYTLLVEKLDKFVRKYYTNELLKGAILFVSLSLFIFLTVIGLESVGHFGTTTRAGLFYSSLVLYAGILGKFIAIPLMKLNKLGTTMDHKGAAKLIGHHFPEVKDKLLNTLELKETIDRTESELISASIDRRVKDLKPVPFAAAVDFSGNRKYLKYALPPLLILLILWGWDSKIITEATDRIINHNEEYKAPPPYEFMVLNDKLSVVKQEEIEIRVKVSGRKAPSSVAMVMNGSKYRMKKISKVEYSYKFRVNDDTRIQFVTDELSSNSYTVKALPRPLIQNFVVELDYPDYTGRKDEKLKSMGDLDVPEGTKAKWVFNTDNVDQVVMNTGEKEVVLEPGMDQRAEYSRELVSSGSYSLYTGNEFIEKADSVEYFIEVKKDAYPQISVSEMIDTTDDRVRYFDGIIEDDYGFSGLSFTYVFRNGKKKGQAKTVGVPFNRQAVSEKFIHFWNIKELNLEPGDEISYYFTVSDNDGYNGSKSASSGTKIYRMPTEDELKEDYEAENESIKSKMDDVINMAAELEQERKRIETELSNSRNMSWQQKQKLEQWVQDRESLQNQIQKIREQMEENNNDQEEYKDVSEEDKEKRDKIDDIMEQLLSPEIMELIEEIKDLMDKLDKEPIIDKLQEMSTDTENMEDEMRRAKELLGQELFQEKLDELIDSVDQFAEDQEDLANDVENKNISKEEAKDRQDKLDDMFEQIKEDMDALNEINDDLERKHDMSEAEQKAEQAEQQMQDAKEQMQNNKMKKAGESQKKAGESAEQMSQALQNMQSQSQEKKEEDYGALRQLMENLIEMSFDQEEVMDQIKGLDKHDPMYFEVGQKQRKIMDNAKSIKDSLYALSKRIIQIQSIVNKEIGEINHYMELTLEDIGERRTAEARNKQQHVMTSTNNLALLLDEVLQQMQQQMASQMPGTGMCNKPGGMGQGKPSPKSMPSIQQMQQELADQLQKMKKDAEGQQKDGKKPGDKPGDKPGNKPGNKPGDKPGGQQGNQGQPGEGMGQSEQLAKLAAQQAAIREQLKKVREQLNKDGSGFGNGLNKIIQDMEKTEEDIIFKQISDQTLKRQKDILTRLLEHERADRERGWEEKREAREAKDQEYSNPERFLEYKRRKQKELELLRTIPPDLRRYYKKKVNNYFNSVE